MHCTLYRPLIRRCSTLLLPAQTPTYTLAGVLLFFLVLSLLFERSTHLLIWFLKKHNRHGLATAVSNLVMELTLIG
jgi:hypothetical protein